MAESKKTYYQISFTGAQALAAILLVLLAMAVSFFLGAKAGFERTDEIPAVPAESLPAPAPTKTEIAPDSSSAKPASAAASSAAASATATPSPAVGPPPAPSTEEAQVFEDREAGVSEEPKPEKAPSRTEITVPAKPGAKAGAKSPAAAPRAGPASPGAAVSPPKGSASAPKAGAAGPAGFFVQVLSTSSKPEAVRWKGKLAAKKYNAVLSMVEGKNGKMYRLRLGPYRDKEQARKVAAKISEEFKRQAWVAPEE
jgi:DedD protein